MKSMRLTIRKMLKDLKIGSKLRFAENGKEGMEVLRGDHFDLAMIDWNMPVMNGIEMLEDIRNDAELRDLPVIMITAEAEREIVAQVAEIEIDGYLLKPLTPQSLETRISNVIDRLNNPEPAKVHRLNAREFEEKGDFYGAIDEIKKALVHKPSASRLLRELGLLHFKIQKNQIGEKCLLKAVSLNRQDTVSRVYLADYYLKTDQLEKAGKYYLEVLSLSRRYNDRGFDIGRNLLKKGYRSTAFSIFSKVISNSKKQSEVRDTIIDICFDLHEYEFPKELLEKSIRENPSNYDLVYKAGLIAESSGDIDGALDFFLKVDRHVRGHLKCKYNIANIYYQKSKFIQADDYLNQILRIDPGHQAALSLRRLF
ncbi:MAG: response regulator [Desulfobacteraceae bacterium]|nr:MAG: response regulator [Desulfobacteraceae bacterium]